MQESSIIMAFDCRSYFPTPLMIVHMSLPMCVFPTPRAKNENTNVLNVLFYHQR
jgi:hypothetical protein